MNYWLVKSDPEEYRWADLVRDRLTAWTGVRNFAARNHLREMKKGDHVLFYHSQNEKAVVGIAKVIKENYTDLTAKAGEQWSVVDLAPVRGLKSPVTLQTIKTDKRLSQIALVRQSRLSVMPLSKVEFDRITEIGK